MLRRRWRGPKQELETRQKGDEEKLDRSLTRAGDKPKRRWSGAEENFDGICGRAGNELREARDELEWS